MYLIRYIWNCLFVCICLLFSSCKQTVVIHETVQIDEPATRTSLMDFIQTSLIDWSFVLWVFVFSLIALIIRMNSYALLRWFRRKYLSSKVVIVLLFLIGIFAVGCIPQESHGAWFAIPVMAVICSTYIVFKSIAKRYKARIINGNLKDSLPESVRRKHNLRLLGKIIVWVWTGGWLLYFLAIAIAKTPHVGAELLWRSAIASLNLFLTNIDSTIIDDIQGHDILKGMISCVGMAAVICTVLLILSLVLYRLMAYLHIKHLVINDKQNHLYVFFGMNDASKLLADSVYKDDPQSVIVFIESSQNNDSEQDDDKIDGWKNLVGLITHRRKTFLEANEDERRALTISNCDICNLEYGTKDEYENDVLGNIGVESVKRIIQDLKSVNDPQLYVFFLSEDRDNNVQSTAILAKDDLIGAKEFQTTIYCHARRNTINRIIEDLGIGTEKRIDVRILDSSHLAIESLKRDVKNHPVSYVNVSKLNEENPGSVTSDFVTLVMGFGETGQEAVEFLYEYGAFVHKDATQLNSKRSPFTCYVLDNEMKNLEGHFIAGTPGAFCKRCCEVNEKALIQFFPFDYRSDEFFTNILDRIVEKLNYVVVAIGDDEDNMTVAVEILRYVRKKRDNLDNFCIYVRAYEKGSFKHLSDIANHYNRRLRKDDNDNLEKIVLFGQNEKIYTYDLVIRDKYQEDGEKYYETYRSLNLDPNPDNDEGPWRKRHDDTMNGKCTKWERLSKIRRKESQDRSNAIHALTKMKLLQEAIGEENVRDFAQRVLERRTGRKTGITYPLLSLSENRLMLNLAMCEHLRWNAAHEMMGYVNNTEEHGCNELSKKHNCLKPWQNLDDESDAVSYIDDYKLFDFGVVETSFKLKCQ